MQKPTVYILHGDDLFGIQHHLDNMLAKMGDPAMVEMNLARLDGRDASEDEIYNAANALPFLADRRMLILTHPFSRLKSEPARARFRAMLDKLPESTALVLQLDDIKERGDWVALPGKHWLRRWMSETPADKVHYLSCELPSLRDMPAWVRHEATKKGGQITFEAATALVQHIGNDTRAASLEIEKLLAYVGPDRPVEVDEVELLSAQSGQANIFEMIDALSAGNAALALNLLHRLLDEEDEISLFGMVVRQFRLLLQTREILDEGGGLEGISREIDRREFIVRKLADQARRFSMASLEAIYRRLLDIDEAVKTGQMPMDLALDTLVVDLAR
jgi:DNA polymerase III subunit delta